MPATDYVALVTALAPLVEDLAPIVVQMVASISQQSGKDAETILSETQIQLDSNEAKLLADMAAEVQLETEN